MAKGWKEEHRFLYNDDGSPTPDLEALRAIPEPPKPRFPTVCVRKLTRAYVLALETAAFDMGRAKNAAESDAAYKALGLAREALYTELSALERKAGIKRQPVTLRF